jgi:anti-anti-sigma factor
MPDTQVLPVPIADREDLGPSSFACSATNAKPGASWVQLTGELDIMTAPQLEQTLESSWLDAPLVVLDLRELEFIDSTGVHAIVSASSRARQSGRRLVLLRGAPSVDRMFALAGCSDALEIGDVDGLEPPAWSRPGNESAS